MHGFRLYFIDKVYTDTIQTLLKIRPHCRYNTDTVLTLLNTVTKFYRSVTSHNHVKRILDNIM